MAPYNLCLTCHNLSLTLLPATRRAYLPLPGGAAGSAGGDPRVIQSIRGSRRRLRRAAVPDQWQWRGGGGAADSGPDGADGDGPGRGRDASAGAGGHRYDSLTYTLDGHARTQARARRQAPDLRLS